MLACQLNIGIQYECDTDVYHDGYRQHLASHLLSFPFPLPLPLSSRFESSAGGKYGYLGGWAGL
eukprot:4978665-Amphidinium_carterae.1